MIVRVEMCDVLTGEAFEQVIKQLFQVCGYLVETTNTTADQGVDLILKNDKESIAVQCKRYSGTVGNSAVQEVFSGMYFYGCDKAMVVTNSFFSSSAKKLAKRLNVELIDRKRLEELLNRNKTDFKGEFYKNEKLVETIVNSGYELMEIGKHVEGIELLNEFLKYKNHIKKVYVILAFNNLGLCYSRQGNKQKAIETYNEALQMYTNATIVNNLVVTYRSIGEYKKAIHLLNEVEKKTKPDFLYDSTKEMQKEIEELLSITEQFNRKEIGLEMFNKLKTMIHAKYGEKCP